MNRYQIYLDPQSVSTLDQLADLLEVPRSQVIRDGLDRLTLQYQKIIAAKTTRKTNKNPLLEMAGFIKNASPQLSQNVDDIYLRD